MKHSVTRKLTKRTKTNPNSDKTWAQFKRFAVVGVINTLFGLTVYELSLLAGLHFTLASLISQVLGITWNYFTTGRLVFGNKKKNLFFRFVSVYGITYLTGILGIWLLKFAGLNEYISGALVTVPNAVLSFFLNKYYTFKER